MKFTPLALSLASAVLAQNATLIPTNITSSCSSFLAKLNTDATLSTCVTPLINATGSFSPASSTNLTTDTINFTLASLCKTVDGCEDSTIRGWLAEFYSACQAELTSTDGYNAEVRELYDILYVVNPLKAAVCSIDSANQDYCVNELRAVEANTSSASASASASASGSASASASASGAANNTLLTNFAVASDILSPVSFAAANLYITISTSASSLRKRFETLIARADGDSAQYVSAAAIITPNTTTYRDTNLPFLFLQPEMASTSLCTPCTREILVAYVKWESAVPYALGLSSSPILGGQRALWSAIKSTCGESFTSAITTEAGVYASSGNTTTSFSGAEARFVQPLSVVLGAAVLAGAAAMF